MQIVEPWDDLPLSLMSFVSEATCLTEVEAALTRAGLHIMTTPGLGTVAMALNCDHSDVQGRWGAVVLRTKDGAHLVIAFERVGDLTYLQLTLADTTLEGLNCSSGKEIVAGEGRPFVFLPCDDPDRPDEDIRAEVAALFERSPPAAASNEIVSASAIYMWLATSICDEIESVFATHKRSVQTNTAVDNAVGWMLDTLPTVGQVAIARYMVAIRRINFNPLKTPRWNEFARRCCKYI